jgi:hypothetical protein
MTENLINKRYTCEKHGFTDTTCDACIILNEQCLLDYKADLSAKARAYRIKNKEAINIRERQYYSDNKEAIKAKSERYKLKNKEAIALNNKQHYIDNREILIAHNKEWRIQNKEHIDLYDQKRIECVPCGINIKIRSKARHCKTQMHQHNLTLIETIDDNIK